MSPDISKLLQCFSQEHIKGNRQIGFIKMVLNRHLKSLITYHFIAFNFHKYHRLLIHTHTRNGSSCFQRHHNPEGRSREHTRRYLLLPHYNSQKAPRPGGRFRACVPAHLGAGGRGSAAVGPARGTCVAWATGLTAVDVVLVRTRRCSQARFPLALPVDPPWGAWARCSGKCRVCLWRRWKRSLPPKGSIRYRGARGPRGGRGWAAPRGAGCVWTRRGLPGAVEPPCRLGAGAVCRFRWGGLGYGSSTPRAPGSCTFLVAREGIYGRIFLIRRFKLAIAWKLKTRILNNVPFFLGYHLLRKVP